MIILSARDRDERKRLIRTGDEEDVVLNVQIHVVLHCIHVHVMRKVPYASHKALILNLLTARHVIPSPDSLLHIFNFTS